MRGFLVEVPFRTSQMLHLKASALFLKVQTLHLLLDAMLRAAPPGSGSAAASGRRIKVF